MKSTSIVSSLLGTAAAMFIGLSANAGVTSGTYLDAQNDLFDNGFANLDIASVHVSDNGTTLSIAVTTRGFSDWTKYLLFLDTAAGGTNSNPWGRPIDIGSNSIDSFVGSWVDQPNNNAQFWTFGSGWNLNQTISNSVSGNTVIFNLSMAGLGLGAGSVLRFDVATSGGGGGDAGVDHLSNSGVAMSGWGATSYAGTFLSYTTTPAPGVIALAGLAGLVKSRRRR